MAPRRKNVLPKELPANFIMTDTERKSWRLGRKIGEGGFGRIYLASRDVDRPVVEDTDFVIKVEYQENGPLFSELKFYQRAAKEESRRKWMESRKLDFLGIPIYWGTGLAEWNGFSYRFMVMDRLGSDLQKVWKEAGPPQQATVLQLGQRLLDILEYVHENEYVHADIKAANLMQGYRDTDKMYLVDYGLSYRYCPCGVHKEYKEDPKNSHNGTIEYTSLDAHKGLKPSRRGDLQILGFCLLHWLCGSLPWNHVLNNPALVQKAKTRLMDNLPDSVQQLASSRTGTDQLADFLLYVKTLTYQDKPDYQHLKQLLASRGDRLPPPEGGLKKAAGACRPEKGQVQETKSRPVPAHCLRARPLPKPLPQKEKVGPRGNPRPRPDSAQTDQDKDVRRPRPVPACYLRGPPVGPRVGPQAPNKQKNRPKQNDSLTVTSVMHNHKENVCPHQDYGDSHRPHQDYGDSHRPHQDYGDSHRPHQDYGDSHRPHQDYGDSHRLHQDYGDSHRLHQDYGDSHRPHQDYGDSHHLHQDYGDSHRPHQDYGDSHRPHQDYGDSHRPHQDWDRSAVKGPGQEAGPTQSRRALDWWVVVGVCVVVCIFGGSWV
ncbi:serine/threonine-protein kinase VRK1-like isoform X2 [Echeneis naucrates]|uniref:serine/threonine-protein kinase VRK1-like isoform X2 n=1 Tax=Echeneis naucrates TaxID=173247 RepID=UPI0011140E09|nr:serine/threonine-protein kinase VRK1-like isoform X2 [Echeneis naucrates]